MHIHFNMHPIIFVYHAIIKITCHSSTSESVKKKAYTFRHAFSWFLFSMQLLESRVTPRGASMSKKKKPNMHTCQHAFPQFEIGVPQSAILRRVKGPEHLTLPRRPDTDTEPSFMFRLQANNRVLCSLVISGGTYAQILSAKC